MPLMNRECPDGTRCDALLKPSGSSSRTTQPSGYARTLVMLSAGSVRRTARMSVATLGGKSLPLGRLLVGELILHCLISRLVTISVRLELVE